MRRGLYVLAFVAALCGIGASIAWIRRPPTSPGINIENFRRLRIGMTVDEVTEIFGRTWHRKASDPDETTGYWYSPAVTFQIYVDETTGRITGGETLWSNMSAHEVEFVKDDSWEACWNRFWFGELKVRE